MRFVRMSALLAVVLAGAGGCAQAAANSAGVWVRVSPTTVTAGYQTEVQASCGENVNSATVSSSLFGSVTLQPIGGVLTTKVTIPGATARGTYDVRLTCPSGSRATTTLTVLNTSTPPSQQKVRGPGTGGGFLARTPTPSGSG